MLHDAQSSPVGDVVISLLGRFSFFLLPTVPYKTALMIRLSGMRHVSKQS